MRDSDNLNRLSDLREAIHAKSHKLASFQFENRSPSDWDRFYASTDTLLDMSTAFSQFFSSESSASLLERLGFLQALTISRDAVSELSKSVGLVWSPYSNSDLKNIREIRHRVAGHPVWSEKARDSTYIRSSAMQDLGQAESTGFPIVLYYEKGSERVFLSYSDLFLKNEKALAAQLVNIEGRMDEIENEFMSAGGVW